jgi:hypothetical protein
MKGKSKEYIQAFRHGARWTIAYMSTYDVAWDKEDILKALKEATKSLKEGR